VVVTVANDTTAPTVTLTALGGTVSGTVQLAATAADDFGVTGVQFLVDGAPVGAELTAAPYELAWATLGVANGAHTLTAVARDAAGHQTTASVVVTVANDTTAPSIALIAPATATVAGLVTIAATAADDVAVAGVQFLLDGLPLGAEITTAPYQFEWTTLAVVNGEHTLTAVARDAAGNQTTAMVRITVANEILAP
jgi:hypothetical protein